MNATFAIGNQQGIGSVVAGYGERLLRFIRSRVSAEADAEDVLQEVWVQLSLQASLDDIEHMSGWLYRVAKNKIADLYRSKKWELLESEEEEEVFKGMLPSLFVPADDPAIQEWQELFREALAEALDEMPLAQSDVFVKNEIEGMTLQAIANERGAPLSTIIARKRYAVRFLRKKLAPLYDMFLHH